jgi:hypothetical protein
MAQDKKIVTAFGRVNPPTVGHEKLFNKVREIADREGAEHDIRVSHSNDPKKNPLTQEQKLGHLRTMFPDHNFSGSSKEQPSFMSHLHDLHNKGYTHVTMVAGDDRVPEYQKVVDKYNKPEEEGGQFNFKSIKIQSAGHRDPDAEGAEGMSASKMREHAQQGNYHSFKAGLPASTSHEQATKLYNDVRRGMGINENRMSFSKWLSEDIPTNSSSMSIRGLGNVTGVTDSMGITDPSVTGYAVDNAQTQAQIAQEIQGMHGAAGLDGGDQPKNIIGFKASMAKAGGSANYTGKKR